MIKSTKVEEVATEGLAQVGTAPAPALVKTWPAVPGKLFGMIAPLNFILPATSNLSVGAVLPIPTLPPLVNVIALM